MDPSSDNLRAMETVWSETDLDWEIGLAMDSDDEFLSALVVPLATSSPIKSPIASPAFTPQRLLCPSPLFVERLPHCPPLVLPPLSPPPSLSPVPSCFSPGFLEKYEPCFSPVSSGTMSPRKMSMKRPRDDSGADEPRRRIRRRLTI